MFDKKRKRDDLTMNFSVKSLSLIIVLPVLVGGVLGVGRA
jgi:hypothetical protein